MIRVALVIVLLTIILGDFCFSPLNNWTQLVEFNPHYSPLFYKINDM